MSSAQSIVTSALELAAKGFPVFPCAANKAPIVKNGFLDATIDPVIIRTIFSRPGAELIGIPTGEPSGVDILDFDYRHGAKDWETDNLCRLPETRVHQTLSGGRHLLFQHTPGVRNSAGQIAPGVDVRGSGGYFVTPPSPGYSVIADAPPADWPPWLLVPGLALPKPPQARPVSSGAAYTTSSKRLEGQRQSMLTNVRNARDGYKHTVLRNSALVLGGIAAEAGFSVDEAVQWLLDALPKSVVDWKLAERTARWALEAGMLEPIELEDRPRPNGTRAPPYPDTEPPPEHPDDPGYGRSDAGAGPETEDKGPEPGPGKARPAGAAPIDWPEPLDFLADADMTGMPELKPEHLPDALAPFVFDTAERMGADPSTVALSSVVSTASVIDDNWAIQPTEHDWTYTERPCVWGAIVGPPSIKKSPVIKATTAPIDKLEAEARKRHQEEMRDYRIKQEKWKKAGSDPETEPKAPRLDRYMVENTTIEAIGEVLRHDCEAKQNTPAHKVLVRQDELSEWVASFDRYSGGKGGADRGAYLRLYGGGRHTIDRIGRGSFAVENWSGGILGGIQPEVIGHIAKNSADDGLLQRFAYAVPLHQLRGVDRAPDASAINRYYALFPALTALHPPRSSTGDVERVVLHDDARQHWDDIQNTAEAYAALPDTSTRLKSALGKWPGLWARIVLVFHLIGIADARANNRLGDPLLVANDAARRATAYLKDILLPHLLRADAVMFDTIQTGHAKWIAGHILAKGLNKIAARDIIMSYRPLRAPEQRREMLDVMTSLEAMGWVRPVLTPDGRQPTAWQINPKVHVFTEHARRERAERDAVKARIRDTLTKR